MKLKHVIIVGFHVDQGHGRNQWRIVDCSDCFQSVCVFESLLHCTLPGCFHPEHTSRSQSSAVARAKAGATCPLVVLVDKGLAKEGLNCVGEKYYI